MDKINEEVNKIKKFMGLLTEDRKYEYGCAMIYFTFDEMNKIHDLIDSNDLYEEEGEDFGLETEPHVTLLFGLHDDVSQESVEKVLDKYTFYTCKAHNPSLFKNEKYDVLKFDIEGDNLSDINKELKEFPHTSDYPDYHPHMTIAYLKPGKGQKYANKIKELSDKYWLAPQYAVYSKPSGKKDKISINVD
jgi:hypothetical protein